MALWRPKAQEPHRLRGVQKLRIRQAFGGFAICRAGPAKCALVRAPMEPWAAAGRRAFPDCALTVRSAASHKGRSQRAVSSAVEHTLHTRGVIGSIPIPPTILFLPVRAGGIPPNQRPPQAHSSACVDVIVDGVSIPREVVGSPGHSCPPNFDPQRDFLRDKRNSAMKQGQGVRGE